MDQLYNLTAEFWKVLEQMAPYLLFGFAVAGFLSAAVSPKLIEKHLGGESFWSSLKASLFGVPLPLCSCGVIPVSASLRRSGAGKGPTIAFLISTPQTGVDSIMVTYALMGGVFAIFRPIVAFVSGLAGGVVVSLFAKKHASQSADGCCGSGTGHAEDHIHSDECFSNSKPVESSCCAGAHDHSQCSGQTQEKHFSWGAKLKEALRHGFITMPQDIGKALLIGVLIAAAITAFLPPDAMPGVLGGGIGAMLIMMLAGIPMYVCATASVPIAMSLIMSGVSPGAALVFLMTGPATNAATIAVIARIMGKFSAFLYLLVVAVCAVAAGLVLDAFFDYTGFTPGAAHSKMMPSWVGTVSAIVLLAILTWGMCKPWIRKLFGHTHAPQTNTTEQQLIVTVSDMTCSHCQRAINDALMMRTEITGVSVDLTTQKVFVSGDNLNADQINHVIAELGFTVKNAELTEAKPACCGHKH